MLNKEQLTNRYTGIMPIGIKDPLIQTLLDLSRDKKVDDDSLLLVEGLWAYEKLINSRTHIKDFVFCPEFITSAAMMKIVDTVIKLADKVYKVSAKTCERLSGQNKSEGFYLLCKMPKSSLEDIKLYDNNLIVVLDGIDQAGNAGTILRSVDGAGGDAVILSSSRVRKNNMKLIKASMGACFTLPVVQTGTKETMAWLVRNGFKIIVTDLTAQQSYFDMDYSGRVAIVAGNEIHGVCDEWRQQQCHRVIIPMLGGGDSLNVGMATTLVTYEASLQQKGFIKRSS